jgi:DNA primase
LRLSEEFRKSLESMAASYQKALSADALGYLRGRGISPDQAAFYRIGQVDGSHAEHAIYAGMLCFPYITKLGGVVSLKFRQAHDCTDDCGHAKFIGPYETRLYNTLALDRADRLGVVAIAEGEIDTLTLDALCRIPAVGIPGVDTWKQHPEWREVFRGYERVLVFPDNDEINPLTGKRAGAELAKGIARDIDTAKLIQLPGKDVNSTFLTHGAETIRKAAGLDG